MVLEGADGQRDAVQQIDAVRCTYGARVAERERVWWWAAGGGLESHGSGLGARDCSGVQGRLEAVVQCKPGCAKRGEKGGTKCVRVRGAQQQSCQHTSASVAAAMALLRPLVPA